MGTIRLLNQGRISVPDHADPGIWIISEGKLTAKPSGSASNLLLLGEICDAYYRDQLDKADTTLQGEAIHINHLKRGLGQNIKLASLTPDTMQSYINKRVAEDNRYGGKVSGKTVKKELTTFMQIWTWARQRGHVTRPCLLKDPQQPRKWVVKIPKPEETERFMTWDEIARRIARGGIPEEKQKELWRFLYLDEEQVAELLAHVGKTAVYPFVFPMFALVAFTGMRRSEMCNSMIDDLNFDDGIIVVRERKRRKDRATTTRDVPMHPALREVMLEWLRKHPGGQHTIRKANSQLDMLARDEAQHQFRRTLAGSKWQVVRGFHVLRHSFGAISARAGVPMTVIAKWMGHTTDEMMRLYQHLFPQDERKWMQRYPLTISAS
jgi:integrase